LKTLTGKINGDETISGYKIVYDRSIHDLTNDNLDVKLKHDLMVLSKSQQLVYWNAYCIGHELQEAKQRAIARKQKWAEYLNLTVGTIINSPSYADKLINYYNLCKKYIALRYVSGSMNWIIDRVDAIRSYLDDFPEEAVWWSNEPGSFVITSTGK